MGYAYGNAKVDLSYAEMLQGHWALISISNSSIP
jgi:hypothetical protein